MAVRLLSFYMPPLSFDIGVITTTSKLIFLKKKSKGLRMISAKLMAQKYNRFFKQTGASFETNAIRVFILLKSIRDQVQSGFNLPSPLSQLRRLAVIYNLNCFSQGFINENVL